MKFDGNGHGIETYPVGILRDIKTLRQRLAHPGSHYSRLWHARNALRWFARSWNRRSYWNGYLAEWHYCPEGVKHTKAGRGWTRRAARRRLGQHIVASNLIATSSVSATDE